MGEEVCVLLDLERMIRLASWVGLDGGHASHTLSLARDRGTWRLPYAVVMINTDKLLLSTWGGQEMEQIGQEG